MLGWDFSATRPKIHFRRWRQSSTFEDVGIIAGFERLKVFHRTNLEA
jgi:hypothetical protein